MLRSDFDVRLAWITEEDYNNDKPTLALDWEQGIYQIFFEAIMTRYLSAYDTGYAAFLTGQPAHYNPYTHFTIEHTAWDKGYADAKALNQDYTKKPTQAKT